MVERKPKKSITKRLDWSEFTNFRSRTSKKNLSKLCSSLNLAEREEVFRSADESGLYPIHWAAIHNRSDFIEYMVENGCPLRIKCLNKFLAHGTAMHLAAMNGCIEAASILLKINSRMQGTQNPVVKVEPPEGQPDDGSSRSEWLSQRDSEGQTPLMRCATPRSKRMDTVRDLLRKNLWSLSARPSEMALYLISQGADWRQTDSLNGQNLLHLSIINDYEDIVDLLLVIDRELVLVPTRVPAKEERRSSEQNSVESSPESQESSSEEALINRRAAAEEIVELGIKPLQLAILYGRLGIVERLWLEEEQLDTRGPPQSRGSRYEELNRILSRVFWSSSKEFFKYARAACIKLFLLINLVFLVIIWMPSYLRIGSPTIVSGDSLFLLTFLSTSALLVRVAFKNPGFLRRGSPEYHNTLQRIINGSKAHSKERIESEAALSSEGEIRLLCHRCRCIRVPRSRHCNQCNRCIEEFDHHCIYLSCCVGRENRLDFLALLVAFTLTGIHGYIILMHSVPRENLHQIGHLIGRVYILVFALLGGGSTFFMLKRACQGVTMFEEIRSKRIRDIFGPAGTPADINKSHRTFATTGDSFWRYSPNRFITGDLSLRAIMQNLREFSRCTPSCEQWFLPRISPSSSNPGGSREDREKALKLV